jgi:transcriptional regulator with XRE-family HTH domain
MDSIGLILKEERLRLGMSQDEFAVAGGVKRRAQQNYEQDERSPDALYLRKLAAIGVDVQYVLTGRPSTSLLGPEESELVSGFRKMDLRGKVSMLGMLDVVGNAPAEKPVSAPRPKAGSVQYHGDVEIGQKISGGINAPQTFYMGSNKSADAKKPKKKLAK